MSEFRAEAAQGRDELHSLRRHLRDVEVERDDFRRRHRLKRTARWAAGGNLTLKVGVLLALFVFEVFLNGFFLAKGSELGYVGGAAEALVFALLNIGVASSPARSGCASSTTATVCASCSGSSPSLAYSRSRSCST